MVLLEEGRHLAAGGSTMQHTWGPGGRKGLGELWRSDGGTGEARGEAEAGLGLDCCKGFVPKIRAGEGALLQRPTGGPP